MTLFEHQLVRPDGSVLLAFVLTPGQGFSYTPVPGMEIRGPCATRCRMLPDGAWVALAYLPQGFPGPTAPWPSEAAAYGIASAVLI